MEFPQRAEETMGAQIFSFVPNFTKIRVSNFPSSTTTLTAPGALKSRNLTTQAGATLSILAMSGLAIPVAPLLLLFNVPHRCPCLEWPRTDAVHSRGPVMSTWICDHAAVSICSVRCFRDNISRPQ